MTPRQVQHALRTALCALLLAVVQQSAGEETADHGIEDVGGRRKLQDGTVRGRSLIGSPGPWVEPLSWKPRAFLHHNFITADEADHIVALAKPFMKRSTVVGNNGDSVLDEIRSSYGTFLDRLHDPMVTSVEQRVAAWTKINLTHQEDLQVLRYGLGQKYGSHYDSLDNDSPRVATVLLYLSDVEEGGETAFPHSSEWIDDSVKQRMEPFSGCAAGQVAAKPKRGDALLFFSLNPDGSHDMAAMHTGCPVVKGVKWTATIWIHSLPFREESLGQPIRAEGVPDDCEDFHAQCKTWAATGECQRNAGYMKGDGFGLGTCRRACEECEVCGPGDTECRSRNRVRAGYLALSEL